MTAAPATIPARARFVGTRIDTRALEQADAVAHAPLMLRAGGGGRFVVFRFGAWVGFGVGEEEERALAERLRSGVAGPAQRHHLDDDRAPEREP